MDVRCERCKTLYELDDTRVSEAGTTVRCTTCGHVFRVRKKVLLMTEAVGNGGESTAVPPPVVEKPAWRVRSPSGRVIAFRELTSMQKWIVERKFGRDDEISLHGDHWKRLGDIAELQPFFLLLDEVDRVHQLEERLRRAEPPDEAPSALERELGGEVPDTPPAPIQPTPTPIRLEVPIEPESEARPAAVSGSGFEPPPPEPPAGVEPITWPGERSPEPSDAPAVPPRTGTPSAFSLEEIQEATRPSPDDLPMPEGTIEPPSQSATDEADQPRFTRRAGLGVDPGVVDDTDGWETPPRRSKAPWVATFLLVVTGGLAIGAYFTVWVPAQEEKLRQEAQRARLEDSQKARDAADAEVRERERRAKEDLLAGMAGRADAGSATSPGGRVDGGTGGSAGPEPPRGSLEAPPAPGTAGPEAPRGSLEPAPTSAPTRAVAAAPPARQRGAARPDPRSRTFEEWMALGERERERSRARAALDAYDRAIALDGSRAEAYLGQGRAHLELGDPRSAVAAFRRALMVNSRYSVAEFWLGEAFRRSGQGPQAAEAYERYLEASPEGAEAPRAREALNALR
jgi:predicted Zn finger-like uncharacterized protein